MAPAARVRTAAIVVAGGRGERFGAPKQFLTVGSSRLVDLAVAAAAAVCDFVVVVIPGDRTWDGVAVGAVAVGGASRSESVRAGLGEVPADVEVVAVHDAARPLAPPSLFELVIDTVRAGADAAVPALPITDTIKRVTGDRAVETLDRAGLVAVQTPQAFRVDALRSAHAAGGDATDDAALVEAAGGTVTVVPGDPRNVKVTNVADLALVERLMGVDAP
ncbi:MAG TPA: 2-C-methyl-D-erythritol 4-phosphate cytidylyltransferase [Acidimicrobiia bacterium]|nr:2-C-methyl-D-erythritol 4-phosphate cytidylyltransferase [Acidimicrobiia bacterium]